MKVVVVLNDGETYTDLEGCKIVIIPEEIKEEDEDEYVKARYVAGVPIENSFRRY